MLTNRYMTSVKNLSAILNRIVEGTAPEKFTVAHLKSIGFNSSNDQGIIPLLKDLAFLSPDGVPTPRYHAYRDRSQSRHVLGESLRDAYAELFHINEKPQEADRSAIEGKFKSVHNGTDRVAAEQAKTFYALLDLADLNGTGKKIAPQPEPKKQDVPAKDTMESKNGAGSLPAIAGLRYNIEIHLPATKDVEVYNSIFKSLKDHLIES